MRSRRWNPLVATKSYKIRLDLRPGQPIVDPVRFKLRAHEIASTQKWLNETREAFNAGGDYLTGWLLRMHRGAGVWREKRDGIWREWQEITTPKELEEARGRKQKDPDSITPLENRELLEVFAGNGKAEAEAIELAECCRRIAKELCPPSEDSSGAQMPRDDLDLLTSSTSTAKGLRARGPSRSGAAKKISGKRPGWALQKAIGEEAVSAGSLDALITALKKREEFLSAKKDGEKKIAALRSNYSTKPWGDVRTQLLEEDRKQIVELVASAGSLDELCQGLPSLTCIPRADVSKLQKKWRKRFENSSWDDASEKLQLEYRKRWVIAKEKAESIRSKSEESGSIAAYKRLLEAGCLPLPGFASVGAKASIILGPLKLGEVDSEWKRAMWNMAGQRVRSHLGWVRRRANERMLWELRTNLFEHGGWIRTKRDGKAVRQEDLTPDDIRFKAPPDSEIGDFQQRAAYGVCQWVKALRQYETDEIPKHLEGVAFGAAEQPRIRQRTAKGWAKVRDKWIELIDKAQKADKPVPSADDLLEAFDQMRTRKTRDFGDRRLFEWLAGPERRWLWDRSDKENDNDCGRDDRDCVAAFIAHNEHLADKPDSITFTRSDSVKHPVWPFFGENSAVEYWLTREQTPNGGARLVLVLKQLLARQPDGSYSAVDCVKIALRGYEDFEKSFALPDDAGDVSAKQALVFRDDLLGGQTRQGTLSGMKLTWERDELEASNRKSKPTKEQPRIYANFSCDAGEAALPDWLTKHVGSDLKLKKPRDGMTRAFFLKKTISKDGATEDGGAGLPPGQRKWPKEAIENGFTVRGTDLGYRTSSAGASWRLWFDKPAGKVSWQVGTCEEKPVYAVLERTSMVSLPGDGEAVPDDEQALRDRLYSLRTRLNLNNALLRIARLLALDAVIQRKLDGEKKRKRSDGTTKRVGIKWKTETRRLDEAEVTENCRKAAEQLVRWASADAMKESLKAIGHKGSLWHWLAAQDRQLQPLGEKVPTTEVPTEKEAREQGKDRDTAKAKRKSEEDAFAEAVVKLRDPLAKALCDGHDAEKRLRATSGLWFEFDRALLRELSYSDRVNKGDKRIVFETGLFRLLRKPPVTKHRDRKDDANNLPHGRTHRGGLSMARLNFLDDVKNLVRRWSCRPRWPGDVRRVPEDAKFDRCDTEHVDNLREHRAKLIAHADVAQALGFEQDLRRGLWRYGDASGEMLWHCPERGHFYCAKGDARAQRAAPADLNEADALYPHRAYDPAHVLVYEDLTRYKMSSDRPKNENAGLARWSHRRILGFAQHIGGLFGVPVTTVDARFSSRYCSQCGAPGCRAVRFDPAWLNQGWMQRILQSNDIRDAAMKSVANDVRAKIAEKPNAFHREADRPWVLRDGGTHFVCANPNCPVRSAPIDADENAAANIGLRFLRGVDGVRATISANGKVAKSIGYVLPGIMLTQAGGGDSSQGEPYWRDGSADGQSAGSSRKRRESREKRAPESNIEEENEDASGRTRYLFRDPSGGLRCRDHWFEGKVFWGVVAQSCAAGIKAVNASRVGSVDED